MHDVDDKLLLHSYNLSRLVEAAGCVVLMHTSSAQPGIFRDPDLRMTLQLLTTVTGDRTCCAVFQILITLRASEAAAQCIVIGPVFGFVCVFVCLWVCYHDNSKLRASILTKLRL